MFFLSKNRLDVWMILSVLFYLSCLTELYEAQECGKIRQTVPSKRSLLIVGGKTVKTHAWPWMAAIRLKTRSGNTRFICGGSLISKRHILTAAHCFGRQSSKRKISDYQVVLGSIKEGMIEPIRRRATPGVITMTPESLTIHRDFQYLDNEHDIAILTLPKDVIFNDRVMPVCLPFFHELNVDHGYTTVTGWGGRTFGEENTELLQEVSLKIIPIYRCRRILRNAPEFSERIKDNMICAGDLSGDTGSCKGDSGGPLFYENEAENIWVQLGIVTFGYRCSEKGYPGVYARVANYMPWIRRVTRLRFD